MPGPLELPLDEDVAEMELKGLKASLGPNSNLAKTISEGARKIPLPGNEPPVLLATVFDISQEWLERVRAANAELSQLKNRWSLEHC